MHAALDVAQWIVGFSAEHGDPVTNLKLQKLLYYGQAWHLVLHDEPLFNEDFEAWVYGPVIPSVYRAFKEFGAAPLIASSDQPLDFDEDTEAHLLETMEVFGGYSSYQLEMMTHREAPWINARGGIPVDAPSQAVISKQAMHEFYSALNDEE